MNLFFEESGDFKSGVVLAQQGESYQVETQSGKRTKVRAKDVLLQFATPAPEQMMSAAAAVAQDIDLYFLWEVAGAEEFSFQDLGQEYFGNAPQPHEAAGLVMRLHSAPMYFYRKGKGRYKAAPEASLKAALAGMEKKRLQAEQQQRYVEQLLANELPEPMCANALQLLFRPDKNSIEYKALEQACHQLQTNPERLMLALGGVASPKELHLSRFLFEHFPRGTDFPVLPVPEAGPLPVAAVQAFSIDDASTTEIDDAFSVVRTEDGKIRVGIHIAAPGLCINSGDVLDQIARQRMSTVYMPGAKITMLPDAVVDAYTLAEGRNCPALSLYATLDPADWSVCATETRAEMVPIAVNLRHHELEHLVTEEALRAGTGEYRCKQELAWLWEWTQRLEQARMDKRVSFGLRPEQANRVDFSFHVEDDVVSVIQRKRGAPLDKIVAELMIFANSSWGRLMHEHGVPGIYRSQGPSSNWGGRLQVRMVTHAAPHQGLGVDQYAWSTSPLRRYTDLVNQWQILACIRHGVAAPLAAPFKPKDASLFAIVSAFDATYSAYGDFQASMERYWCLRWLAQENARCADAVVLKDEMVRLVDLPLVIRLSGMPQLARGTQVRLDLIGWDEVDLSVQARLLGVTEAAPGQTLALEEDDALSDDVETLEEAVTSSTADQIQAAPE